MARSITWSRSCAQRLAEHRLAASAIASCTADSSTRARCASTRRGRGAREIRAAGAAAPAAQPGADPPAARARSRRCRRSRASTPRSIAASRRSRRRSRCPQASPSAACIRYGFHGLSYEYIAQALPQLRCARRGGQDRRAASRQRRPACARSQGGRSVASTMGFTAVDGLPMGTRCGNLDPGVILYLMDELGMDARAIEKLIYQQSGLLGVSGISSDMRTLQASDEPGAQGRDRPVRLPHRPRAGLARRRAGRARRDRVHRGHRREQRVAARARLPRRRLAGRRARRRGQRARRPAHQHRRQAASPPG